jgi:hypothetical protein
LDPVGVPVDSPRPLALLVPVGSRAAKPHALAQPYMVLRSQGRPHAVLLVSSRHAAIRAVSGSALTINGEPCTGGRELTNGDHFGLGPLTYQFLQDRTHDEKWRSQSGAYLTVDEARVPIRRPIVLIGGGEGADVRLDGKGGFADVGVVLELEEGHVLVSLASPPAYKVNGANRPRHVLVDGDLIKVGRQTIRYCEVEAEAAASVAVEDAPPAAGAFASQPAPPTAAPTSPPPDVNTRDASRVVRGIPENPVRGDPLVAWGPLARAVISAEAFLDVDAAAAMDERDAAAGDRGAGRRWWPLILVLVLLAGGLAAVAWWLRARA